MNKPGDFFILRACMSMLWFDLFRFTKKENVFFQDCLIVRFYLCFKIKHVLLINLKPLALKETEYLGIIYFKY